jgi:hypothetical protein
MMMMIMMIMLEVGHLSCTAVAAAIGNSTKDEAAVAVDQGRRRNQRTLLLARWQLLLSTAKLEMVLA